VSAGCAEVAWVAPSSPVPADLRVRANATAPTSSTPITTHKIVFLDINKIFLEILIVFKAIFSCYLQHCTIATKLRQPHSLSINTDTTKKMMQNNLRAL
jgi:hypothetical protein